MQEVAQALAELRVTLGDACPVLGLAPVGRCNDFARALNVPADADRIADILLTGTARAIDLGRVDGRYFCTVAPPVQHVAALASVSSFDWHDLAVVIMHR